MSNKVTTKDAANAVKAFTEQSEKHVAFGVLADIEQGDFSIFVKGEECEILAMLVMQMAKDDDFKKLLLRAVDIYKIAPIQKIINEDENKH